jgi:hypothetical protein
MPNAVILAWWIDTEFVLDELDEAQAGEYWVPSLLASIVGWLSVELTWLTHGLSAPAHIVKSKVCCTDPRARLRFHDSGSKEWLPGSLQPTRHRSWNGVAQPVSDRYYIQSQINVPVPW